MGIRLSDNGKIKRYDIYANGKKLVSTTLNVFTVYGLTSGKNYAFTVVAVDDAGNESAPSNQVTNTGQIKPAVPSAFAVATINSGTLKLTWTDNSTNETGFELQRSKALAGPYVAIATTLHDVRSYSDSNLTPSTRYYYNLRSVSLTGESAFLTASGTTATSNVTPPPSCLLYTSPSPRDS